MSELIDLRKSTLEFSGVTEKSNKWRSQIKSFITSKKSKIYLTKECLSEHISKEPFSHPHRNEFLPILLNNKIFIFRSQSFKLKNIPLIERTENLSFKKQFYNSKICIVEYNELLEHLKKQNFIDLFIKINFKYKNNDFQLVSKIEYVNFCNSQNYVQPILGYIPMFIENQISFGYCVINIKNGIEQKLQFLLKEDIKLFQHHQNENFLKYNLKNILNLIMFLFRRSEFSYLITLENPKVTFFKYVD